MLLTLDPNRGKYYIYSYEPGKIKVNEMQIQNSIIITPNQIIDSWPPQMLSELKMSHLEQIIKLDPEIVLLGTGNQLRFPTPELLAIFYNYRKGIEVMDTGAACRTYNVLISEGRQAVAALLIR